VRATPQGLRKVRVLSQTIESHYRSVEAQLGARRLKELYELLDALIAVEQPATPVSAPVV
jgi:hypothetical protein